MKFVLISIWLILIISTLLLIFHFGWESILKFLLSLSTNRPVAYILFISVLICVPLIAAPGLTVIEIAAGFVLGWGEGFGIVLVGTVSGSLVCFQVGRKFLRERIREYFDKNTKFRIILKLIQNNENKKLFILILFRLLFIPLFIKNYGPAILDIDLYTFFLAVIITTPPFAALLTFIGSKAKDIASIVGTGKFEAWELIPVVVSVSAFLVFSFFIFREWKKLEAAGDNYDGDDRENLELGQLIGNETITPSLDVL